LSDESEKDENAVAAAAAVVFRAVACLHHEPSHRIFIAHSNTLIICMPGSYEFDSMDKL